MKTKDEYSQEILAVIEGKQGTYTNNIIGSILRNAMKDHGKEFSNELVRKRGLLKLYGIEELTHVDL